MTGAVQILLSTWNGAAWIEDLLDSLASQHFRDWELLVRDDGSSDQTLTRLQGWQQRHPEHTVTILPDRQHLGSNQSFSRLVGTSTAPYLMFCDQDDVWFPDKITIQLQQLQQLEHEHGSRIPLLVHADMVPTDAGLKPLAASFWT
nr:glycosyltransferase [Thiolinea sp.]